MFVSNKESKSMDITKFLGSGDNEVRFDIISTCKRYTYKLSITKDGKTIWKRSCPGTHEDYKHGPLIEFGDKNTQEVKSYIIRIKR